MNWKFLILALLIILVGRALARAIDTVGGTVKGGSLDFVGSGGTILHVRLYIPKGVTAENTAPSLLFIHGGEASRDKYSMFTGEFARRGLVVLNLDQRSHGFSGGAAEISFGPTQYGMGGMVRGAAAVAYLDLYNAMDLIGSTFCTRLYAVLVLGIDAGNVNVDRNFHLFLSEDR